MFQLLLVNCLNNSAIATNYLKLNGMGQIKQSDRIVGAYRIRSSKQKDTSSFIQKSKFEPVKWRIHHPFDPVVRRLKYSFGGCSQCRGSNPWRHNRESWIDRSKEQPLFHLEIGFVENRLVFHWVEEELAVEPSHPMKHRSRLWFEQEVWCRLLDRSCSEFIGTTKVPLPLPCSL